MGTFTFTPNDVMNVWNANCGDLPKCNDLSLRNRFENTKAFLRYMGDGSTLGRVADAVLRVARSPFCTGKAPTDVFPNGFQATYDWFIKPGQITLIEEGQFDGPKRIEPPDPTPSKETTSHWDQPKPGPWQPDEAEFLRCQVAGILSARIPVRGISNMTIKWVNDGGDHPTATAEEVRMAEATVKAMRSKGELPSSMEDFKRKAIVPRGFKELREQQKESVNVGTAAAKEAAPSDEFTDDPW